MPEHIDTSFLTTDERKILALLETWVRARDPRALPKDLRKDGGLSPWTIVGGLAGAGLAAIVVERTGALQSPPLEALVGVVGWVLLLLSALGLVSSAVGAVMRRRAYRAAVPRYLASIGYAARLERGHRHHASSGQGDPRSYYTNGYEPERWFSYSKSERDYMRMTGMDADIYDSNVRDNDKD